MNDNNANEVTKNSPWIHFGSACKAFGIGFISAGIITVIGRYGIELFLNYLNPEFFTIIFGFQIFSLLFISLHFVYRVRNLSLPYSLTSQNTFINYVLILLSVLLIGLSFPALIIYWLVNPHNYKKGIQIAVFFLSVILAILYYLLNQDKFPSIADKVTFFTGVCLAPAGVLGILL